MSNEQSKITMWFGILTILIVVVFTVTLIYAPFIVRIWEVSGNDYVEQKFFFGYWKLFANTEFTSDGAYTDLPFFSLISPVFIIIGLVFAYIFVPGLSFSIGRRHKHYNLQRRIYGILTTITGTFGFTGILLYLINIFYYKELQPSQTFFGWGFIFGVVVFSLIMIFGLIFTIAPQIVEIKVESNQQNETIA
ncbi:MAG: hypothetical protein FK734_01440 [Asgard group archaeon]|nr:hypothetical protein [Asgard group archaeon]